MIIGKLTVGEYLCLFSNYRKMKRHSKPMQDEFTTEMHWEMMQDEMTREDFLVMAVCGAINRGTTKAEALKKYGITEEFYDANYERVMKT